MPNSLQILQNVDQVMSQIVTQRCQIQANSNIQGQWLLNCNGNCISVEIDRTWSQDGFRISFRSYPGFQGQAVHDSYDCGTNKYDPSVTIIRLGVTTELARARNNIIESRLLGVVKTICVSRLRPLLRSAFHLISNCMCPRHKSNNNTHPFKTR